MVPCADDDAKFHENMNSRLGCLWPPSIFNLNDFMAMEGQGNTAISRNVFDLVYSALESGEFRNLQ
jgi:hypothetical protein